MDGDTVPVDPADGLVQIFGALADQAGEAGRRTAGAGAGLVGAGAGTFVADRVVYEEVELSPEFAAFLDEKYAELGADLPIDNDD